MSTCHKVIIKSTAETKNENNRKDTKLIDLWYSGLKYILSFFVFINP